jgi:hypothetical protein
MSIAQLFNYYPKYEYLDNILSATGKKKLTIYVDLKGCMGSLFQEWAAKYLIEQSRRGSADPSVFAATLEFISWHKLYARKRRIDLNMIFFFESGDSGYHKNLLSTYKGNRDLSSYFDIDSQDLDLYVKVKNKNFDLIDKVCNKIPNVSVIRLKFLEADFTPWFVHNNLLKCPDDCANVIYAQDKDMLQCLNENTFQFYKHYKTHKIIDKDDVYSHYFKTSLDWNFDPEYFYLVLAIDGDISDNFGGVKGIGPKTLIKCLPDFLDTLDEPYVLAEKVKRGESIFKKGIGTNNKFIQKLMVKEDIINRNIKLASYRILSDHVDSGYPLNNVERKKHMIDRVENDQKIRNGNVLYEALDKIGMTSLIQEHSVYNLFN